MRVTHDADTVLNLTEFAFVEFHATMIGWTYHSDTNAEISPYFTHADEPAGMVAIAVRKTIAQICGMRQTKARWSRRRERKVIPKTRTIQANEEGMVRRLV